MNKTALSKLLSFKRGFTLVELLVVMAILGILVTLIAGGFRLAQFRGRDAQRKSDLKQVINALELFYNDHGRYPEGTETGRIDGCPFDPLGGVNVCAWGASEFTDGKTIYFKVLPQDPLSNQTYFYRTVPGTNNQAFQIFARLENPRDKNCLDGDCANPPVSYSCGGSLCNYALTSANTTPLD